MVFLSLVVFGFSTKPLTMIRLFAELSGHYPITEKPHEFFDPTGDLYAQPDQFALSGTRAKFDSSSASLGSFCILSGLSELCCVWFRWSAFHYYPKTRT
jgi:hypothetical protein